MILKYLLNIAIILGHTSEDSTILENINRACPAMNQYFLSSMEIKTGCAASMGRELKNKLNRLQSYINSSFTKMPKTDNELRLINSLSPIATSNMAQDIIEQFGIILKNSENPLRDTILKTVMDFSTIYKKMGSPVCLTSGQAESLGLDGGDLELLNTVYLASMSK